tara:strand:- start:5594 stop:6703 length:1110 start_codon:yes stop_codon:yes gene_type:complete
MLHNKIYHNYFFEILKTFFTIIICLTLIALTVRAVNFLDLIVDNGYSLTIYFKYIFFNIFGIAPKFIPLSFLLTLIIFILKHDSSREFVILWTSGVKKIVLVNLLLFTSVIVVLIYLLFSTFLTPLALNKSRAVLSQSQFNSFLPTIRTNQFSDSFKGFTFFVENKYNNEIKNIFLYDAGNYFKNLSSNTKNVNSTTIIADKGIVEGKELILLDGEIISSKNYFDNNEIIKFEQLSIDLNKLKTTVITQPKLQETSTIKLLSCFGKKRENLGICNEETKKEIIPLLIRRILLPAYIPLFVLICSFLLIKQKNYIFNRAIIFLSCLILLISIELLLKYTGSNIFLRSFYIVMPVIILSIIYPSLIYRFSK